MAGLSQNATRRIVDIKVRVFNHVTRRHQDVAGHAHPGEPHQARQAVISIVADDGSEGHSFAAPQILRPHLIEAFVKKVLIGQDPLNREKLWQELSHWQRGSAGQLSDRTLAAVDVALWDLAGRALGVPVYKLIGGYRDKVPAYGSTMCGDDLEGGLATADDYGRFAEKLVKRGYKAIKLHTWMPPLAGAPDVKADLTACAAVREAVGPDIALMIDPYHWYSRSEALELGRGLERLNFAWFEEPMDEQSPSSYAWLAANLTIPVLGPESAAGKHYTRAEWIRAGACDIVRTGAQDVGGISPSLKITHLADSFNMDCEIHGNGAANLTLTAVTKNCRWYERGLLHPFLDYDDGFDYLHTLVDPMDEDGFVQLSSKPGIGEDINFDFIEANLVANPWQVSA
ncbi:mandelate racemase family protein [Brucellaceae bacterium D45D]